MNSIWDWVDQRNYDSDGNPEQQQMIDQFYAGTRQATFNPEGALSHFFQSRSIAERIGDAWWIQLMNHWIIEVLINYKRDMTGVLKLAAESAVEVRKPQYLTFPQRVCIHEDLINAYLNIDPIGNADKIHNALDYMQQEIGPTVECYQCLQELRASFARQTDNLEEARLCAVEYLRASEGVDHHQKIAYVILAELACLEGDFEAAAGYAQQAETLARRENAIGGLMDALAWRAVALASLGHMDEAWGAHRAAVAEASHYASLPNGDYFRGTARFHEIRGSLPEALKVYEHYYDRLNGRGLVFEQCQCALEIARLRKQLDLDLKSIIAAIDELCDQLKSPAKIQEQLQIYR